MSKESNFSDTNNINDEFILSSESNKENIVAGGFRSKNRKSVLKTLDPLYIESPKKSPKINKEIGITEESIDANDSWGFFNMDNSNNANSRINNLNNQIPIDILLDVGSCPQKSTELMNISNISGFLDESVVENNINVSNLIGESEKLMPMKIVEQLRNVHKKKINVLMKKIIDMELTINNLETELFEKRTSVSECFKTEMENKIQNLLEENEDNLNKLSDSHKKALTMKDDELKSLKSIINQLENDLCKSECIKINNCFAIDLYYDTNQNLVREVTQTRKDHEDTYDFLKGTMAKLEKSKEIIEIQKNNNETLVDEVKNLKEQVDNLTVELDRCSNYVDISKEKYNREMASIMNSMKRLADSDYRLENELAMRNELLKKVKSDVSQLMELE